MVVSVQRAPLSPSSLPGYLSATEPASGLWPPARPVPTCPLVTSIITIPGDISHTCLHRAPSTLTKLRVAKQGNKSLSFEINDLCHGNDHYDNKQAKRPDQVLVLLSNN